MQFDALEFRTLLSDASVPALPVADVIQTPIVSVSVADTESLPSVLLKPPVAGSLIEPDLMIGLNRPASVPNAISVPMGSGTYQLEPLLYQSSPGVPTYSLVLTPDKPEPGAPTSYDITITPDQTTLGGIYSSITAITGPENSCWRVARSMSESGTFTFALPFDESKAPTSGTYTLSVSQVAGTSPGDAATISGAAWTPTVTFGPACLTDLQVPRTVSITSPTFIATGNSQGNVSQSFQSGSASLFEPTAQSELEGSVDGQAVAHGSGVRSVSARGVVTPLGAVKVTGTLDLSGLTKKSKAGGGTLILKTSHGSATVRLSQIKAATPAQPAVAQARVVKATGSFAQLSAKGTATVVLGSSTATSRNIRSLTIHFNLA